MRPKSAPAMPTSWLAPQHVYLEPDRPARLRCPGANSGSHSAPDAPGAQTTRTVRHATARCPGSAQLFELEPICEWVTRYRRRHGRGRATTGRGLRAEGTSPGPGHAQARSAGRPAAAPHGRDQPRPEADRVPRPALRLRKPHSAWTLTASPFTPALRPATWKRSRSATAAWCRPTPPTHESPSASRRVSPTGFAPVGLTRLPLPAHLARRPDGPVFPDQRPTGQRARLLRQPQRGYRRRLRRQRPALLHHGGGTFPACRSPCITRRRIQTCTRRRRW